MAESDAAKGAGDTDPVAGETTKKKGGGFLMILLPVLLVSAGGGAYLAYANYPAIAEVAHNFGIGGGTTAEDEGAEGDAGIQYGEFMELTDIIVNPADSNGRRLLMVSLGIESVEPTLFENITAREMVVRDTIIKILGRRTVEDLAAIEQRNIIKDELLHAMNGVVTEGTISRLYFTQYVLQ